MRKLFPFVVFFFSCSGNSSVPKDVLPSAKMGDVLYDVVRVDEMVDFLKLKDSTYQRFNRRTNLYDSVFALHGVTKTGFKKSLDYYESRPDLLKQMFDDLQKKILDNSNKRRSNKSDE